MTNVEKKNTDEWFKGLERDERKNLLLVLHEARHNLGSHDVRTPILVELLKRLEALYE